MKFDFYITEDTSNKSINDFIEKKKFETYNELMNDYKQIEIIKIVEGNDGKFYHFSENDYFVLFDDGGAFIKYKNERLNHNGKITGSELQTVFFGKNKEFIGELNCKNNNIKLFMRKGAGNNEI